MTRNVSGERLTYRSVPAARTVCARSSSVAVMV
jgi:hypothetical protein